MKKPIFFNTCACVPLLLFFTAQAANAQSTYTWGGARNGLWSLADNWVENMDPPNKGNLPSEFIIAAPDAANLGEMLINGNRCARVLTFNAEVGAADVVIRLQTTAGQARSFTFIPDGGALRPVLNVESAVSGDITIGTREGKQGSIRLVRDLIVTHDGSGTLTLGSPVSPATDVPAGLIKEGPGAMVLGGINTYIGNTAVNKGSLTLAEGAELLFKIGADGAGNAVSGTATLALEGSLRFDLSAAGISPGDQWLIVDVRNLNTKFGATFSVVDFKETSEGIWSKDFEGGTRYEFSEGTGTLTVNRSGE